MKSHAFTLIELLVVVLIIGILAAIALPQYQKAVEKARFVEIQIMARALYNAQKIYYMANDTYATNFEDLDITIPGRLSENKQRIETKNGYCQFNSEQHQEIACHYRTDNKFAYIMVRFGVKKILCRARSVSARQICLSVGGEYLSGTIDENSGSEDYVLFQE